MNIELDKAIALILSMAAIIVSSFTIIMTRRNLKKQLRLSKLEEILKVLNYLSGYYAPMLRVFERIEKGIEELKESDIISHELKETVKYRQGFIAVVNREDLIK